MYNVQRILLQHVSLKPCLPLLVDFQPQPNANLHSYLGKREVEMLCHFSIGFVQALLRVHLFIYEIGTEKSL